MLFRLLYPIVRMERIKELRDGRDGVIKEHVRLFNKSKRNGTIHMVVAEIKSIMWNAPRIIDALKEAADQNVTIEIIHGPNPDPKSEGLFTLADEGKLVLYALEEPPDLEYVIIDGKHIRIDSHIKYNTFFLAAKMLQDFGKKRHAVLGRSKKS